MFTGSFFMSSSNFVYQKYHFQLCLIVKFTLNVSILVKIKIATFGLDFA
jgi:hypothetical protein